MNVNIMDYQGQGRDVYGEFEIGIEIMGIIWEDREKKQGVLGSSRYQVKF